MADSYLDVPHVWSSNAEALATRPVALDAVEAEYRSRRRLGAGAAGVLVLTVAVVVLWFGVGMAVEGDNSSAGERALAVAIAAVVAAVLGWWGARLGLRAFRAGRRTMTALAYWYTLPTTLKEAGGTIPLELLSQTDGLGALVRKAQPRAVARGVAICACMALAFLAAIASAGGIVAGEAFGVLTAIGGAVLTSLFGGAGFMLVRSVRRARRVRTVSVFVPDELIDELHELPTELGRFATAVHASSKIAGITAPPIRIGRARGDFMAMAYETVDGPQIVVQDTLLRAPVDVQQMVAAHEVAHLALEHTRQSRPLRARLWWHTLAWAAVLLGWIALYMATDGIHVLVFALVAATMFVASSVTRLAVFAPHRRSQEIEADRQATEYGYPLTAELAEWFKQHDPSERHRLLKRYPWMRTHPTWDQRLAAVRSA